MPGDPRVLGTAIAQFERIKRRLPHLDDGKICTIAANFARGLSPEDLRKLLDEVTTFEGGIKVWFVDLIASPEDREKAIPGLVSLFQRRLELKVVA